MSGEGRDEGGARPSAVEVRVPAKVNLHLRVLARRASGYHSLETVLVAVGLFDRLRVERTGEGGRVELEVAEGGTGGLPDSAEENLVVRAARAYLERWGGAAAGVGLRVELGKGIPAGAGLGGGSADAGFVLRALEPLLGEPLGRDALLELGAAVGSDVPFFLSPSPLTLAWGRGERLLPLPAPPSLPVVIALPDLAVPTGEAFGELAGARGEDGDRPGALPAELARGEWAALRDGDPRGFPVNDFESVVFGRHPELEEIRRGLAEAGARPARLTGSGSALFGIFDSRREATEAARRLVSRFRDVRFVVARTLAAFPDPVAVEPRG